MKAAKAIKNKDEREKEHLRGLTMAHALDGVGFVESVQRRYPMGQLAGQVLGIANAYKGVSSNAWEPGPYSELESQLAAFDRQYLRTLAPDAPVMVARRRG